jgi:hypothetical protein
VKEKKSALAEKKQLFLQVLAQLGYWIWKLVSLDMQQRKIQKIII